ncbi:MAG: helix-turn-helix domain-containing protein [Planctomycetota bacterium]|nr:helix-turn-helix domain-containing protein [Planctomycetota bacterium]
MERTARIARAISDTNRLLALYALRLGELYACQLSVLLDVAPSTVSSHMSILRHAGLVGSHKHGRWVRYELSPADDIAKGGSGMGIQAS